MDNKMTIKQAIEALELAERYVIGGETNARANYPNLAGDFSAIANELSGTLTALRSLKPATEAELLHALRGCSPQGFAERIIGFRAAERRIFGDTL